MKTPLTARFKRLRQGQIAAHVSSLRREISKLTTESRGLAHGVLLDESRQLCLASQPMWRMIAQFDRSKILSIKIHARTRDKIVRWFKKHNRISMATLARTSDRDFCAGKISTRNSHNHWLEPYDQLGYLVDHPFSQKECDWIILVTTVLWQSVDQKS